jgi:hypothetical protein
MVLLLFWNKCRSITPTLMIIFDLVDLGRTKTVVDRVKEEFALLYADSSDETEDITGIIAHKLNFS